MTNLIDKSARLPEMGFVRLTTILKIIPVCRTSWWNRVKSGEYPQPVKLGERTTAWKVEDIIDLMESFSN